MYKKSCFRESFDNWHGKQAENLLKSEGPLPFLLISLKAIQPGKVSLSDITILRYFFNPLSADNRYSLLNGRNLLQRFQMQIYRKRKIFSRSFLHILNLHSILNIFKKKMTVLADVFLNLRIPKNLVREMSKKSCFREPFDK